MHCSVHRRSIILLTLVVVAVVFMVALLVSSVIMAQRDSNRLALQALKIRRPPCRMATSRPVGKTEGNGFDKAATVSPLKMTPAASDGVKTTAGQNIGTQGGMRAGPLELPKQDTTEVNRTVASGGAVTFKIEDLKSGEDSGSGNKGSPNVEALEFQKRPRRQVQAPERRKVKPRWNFF
ncbi:hypothetical protein V5799_013516 [Amblyomma americanum]|uniref:Uncharacterized protein n=1 Tax=Amblyomma americanum TaxID=6943 RepID=A0AAQ4E5N8_AMBAM